MQNPKRVLLAGATGYIGGAIARRWAALGMGRLGEVQVRALARNLDTQQAESLRAVGVELFQADLTRPETLQQAAAGCSLVIHAAGSPAASDGSLADGAANLYAVAADARAARFIHISSMDIYQAAGGGIDEDADLSPSGDRWVDERIAAETVLRNNASGPDCPELTVLRLAAIYGPAAYRWTTRPIESARKRALSVPGAGDFPWFYLFVENMVDAVTAASTAPAAGVYNIFDGVTTYAGFMEHYAGMVGTRLRHTHSGLARLKARLHGWLESVVGLSPDLASEAQRASGRPMPAGPWRADKAARDLGWHPRLSLDEGMDVIQRSNGFHRAASRNDPWRENEEWGEKVIG